MSGQRGNNLCSSHKLSLLVLSLLVVFISSINSVPLDEQRELEPETHSKYYNYDQLTDLLKSLAQKYANIANLTSIGRSVENRELWVMRITRDPTADGPGKPKFKYVGNMHGDETVSRQVLIYLLEDLLEKYGESRGSQSWSTAQIFISCRAWTPMVLRSLRRGIVWAKKRVGIMLKTSTSIEVSQTNLKRYSWMQKKCLKSPLSWGGSWRTSKSIHKPNLTLWQQPFQKIQLLTIFI